MTNKPTPGPWHVDAIGQIFRDGIGPQPRICFADGPAGKHPWEETPTEEEKAANCALIAEAGTVYHETGLTPRQLLNQLEASTAANGANCGIIASLRFQLDGMREALEAYQCANRVHNDSEAALFTQAEHVLGWDK